MCNVCVLNVISGTYKACLIPQTTSLAPIDRNRRTATQLTFTTLVWPAPWLLHTLENATYNDG